MLSPAQRSIDRLQWFGNIALPPLGRRGRPYGNPLLWCYQYCFGSNLSPPLQQNGDRLPSDKEYTTTGIRIKTMKTGEEEGSSGIYIWAPSYFTVVDRTTLRKICIIYTATLVAHLALFRQHTRAPCTSSSVVCEYVPRFITSL